MMLTQGTEKWRLDAMNGYYIQARQKPKTIQLGMTSVLPVQMIDRDLSRRDVDRKKCKGIQIPFAKEFQRNGVRVETRRPA